ncbi:MAG: phosphoribosylglycinamide formyltransferase [Bacteroidales bacterium]|nr:phosphoribosylglycinamide formyltransferase [Bacteroidales bacterium]
MKNNIAIFASGNGSNAENIVNYFNKTDVKIQCCFTNNPKAFVIERMKKYNIPIILFNKNEFSDKVLYYLEKFEINFIVLAGFLWLIPSIIVKKYKDRIINIHPALLPKYGGKGMYGKNVHKAILENKEKYSGITIHLVNEEYDKGKIIFQKSILISENETLNSLEEKIHKLEYKHYPQIIELYIKNYNN